MAKSIRADVGTLKSADRTRPAVGAAMSWTLDYIGTVTLADDNFMTISRRTFLQVFLLATATGTHTAWAVDDAFFESRIRPVLVEHCYECHSSGSEDLMGGLLLDSRDGWQRGGDSGTAVLPGEPDKSLLLEAISYRNLDLKMPPDGILPQQVIADFRKWIAGGAPDPREATPVRKPHVEFDIESRRASHWAWQPVRNAVDGETIDSLIDAQAKVAGAAIAAPAPAHELLRRMTFDLTGLHQRSTNLKASKLSSLEMPMQRSNP